MSIVAGCSCEYMQIAKRAPSPMFSSQCGHPIGWYAISPAPTSKRCFSPPRPDQPHPRPPGGDVTDLVGVGVQVGLADGARIEVQRGGGDAGEEGGGGFGRA